ncbi:MAG: DUF5615 family PIN-like protein [Chloroflexota bacterium]|nr:DUF5615 family PIN-like protein [Chloroflexota bacterium]
MDENIDLALVRGLRSRNPNLDIVRVQEVRLRTAADPVILAWAADTDRIVVTYDVRTMPSHAYTRVAAGQRMPGVIGIPKTLPFGDIITQLLLIAGASRAEEWNNTVRYLPL